MFRAFPFCFATKESLGRLVGLGLSCALLSLCWSITGCDNSCIIVYSNPGGAPVPPPMCSQGKPSGAINLRISSSVVSSSAPTAPNLKHIFVTFQGLEANPSATADENSPDWQELAPGLAKQPMQVDLMAQPADSCVANWIGPSLVPAGVYRQIRLRVVPNHPAAGDAMSEQNECGDSGLNCVVTASGEIRPLTLGDAAPEIHIGQESLTDGFLRIFPDEETNLSIEFNPYSSAAVPSGEAVRVVPVFTATSSTFCDSSTPAQP
jgi:Domain of unknown function (DUF4382)